MTNRTVGIVGGGRIARILLGGWSRARCLPARVVVSEPNEASLARLKQLHPQIEAAGDDNRRAAAQDLVILAVPPNAAEPVTAQVKSSLVRSAIVVSPIGMLPLARLIEMRCAT